MLALCLVFAMMPVPAFAEGEVTGPQTVVPEETKKSEEPAVPEDTKKSEEPVVPEETKKSEVPVIPEETKKSEEPAVPDEGKKPEEPTAVQKVQALIDALPETVTAENRAEVEAQLTAIDDAKAPLGDEARAALDFGKYNAAVAAINVLDNPPRAEVPKTMEANSLEEASVSVTKTFRYNGGPQTLTAPDVTVTLEGTSLTAGTDYTVTAASQTYPGTYSFTVTGTGNYSGTASGSWSIDKGTLGDQTIHLKMKKDGSVTANLDDSLPDLGPNIGFAGTGGHSQLMISCTPPSLVTISEYIGSDTSDKTIQIGMQSDYYEDFNVNLIIHFVDGEAGESRDLTVTMADWNVGDKPNKPTVMGLPEPRYNYQVTYNKKGETTPLYAAPTGVGQYTVTVSCMDEENIIYSGSAEFSVWMEVTFDPNGGTLPADTTATVRINTETLDPLPVPDRTGHTFLGWFTEKTQGNQVKQDTVYTGNTTLYARWKTHTYTISFDANGGEGEMDPLAMTYGKTENLTANGFTRNGYRFTGWNTQADGKGTSYTDGQEVTNLSTVDNDKITLYAQWIKVIDRVNLSLSGHGLDEKVEDVKVTTKDDISFSLDKYGDDWGITKDQNNLTPLSGQLFQADTKYYLFVTFSSREGCTLEELTEKDVYLDGKAALSLTDMQGTATAVFRLPVIYTIETSTGKNGTIDPEGTVAVFEGQDVEIKITPNKGYVVYRLTVDGTNVKTTRTYTFKNVQESHTIHARFLKNGDNAKTGDSFPMGIALGTVTLSAAGLAVLFFLRKRKQTR